MIINISQLNTANSQVIQDGIGLARRNQNDYNALCIDILQAMPCLSIMNLNNQAF